MPGFSAVKSFTNNKTNSKNQLSESDYINRKKSQTIYNSTSNNLNLYNKNQKKDGSVYSGPFYINSCKFLKSVGSYNTNNYELFSDIVRGKYLCNPGANPLQYTFKISEGTFYIDTPLNSLHPCEESLEESYDVSYLNQFQKYPFSNLRINSRINL